MRLSRKADQYKNGIFTWFIGEIKDIDDKQNLNRVKVCAFGYYDGVEKTSDLPWATVMMPNTTASLKGNGANHHLEVGSWVVGFFRDGPSAQDPIIMGSIATQTDGTPDIPEESYVDAGSITGNVAKALAKVAGKVVPSIDNKSYKSKAGHLIEVDNTDGKEQIRVTHKSGSYIHFLEDGTIQIDSGTIDITSSDIITLKSAKKTRVI